MAKTPKITIETLEAKKSVPKNGLIPSMLSLLALEACNGYYNTENTFITFAKEQLFEVLEVKFEGSNAPPKRVFCAVTGEGLINLKIQGTRKDRVLVQVATPDTVSIVLIFTFLRRPYAEKDQVTASKTSTKPKERIVRDVKANTSPKREWIPQIKQFVKIKGGEDLYIITDYDAYKGAFILTFADARLAKHRPNQNPHLEILPTDLEPYTLPY